MSELAADNVRQKLEEVEKQLLDLGARRTALRAELNSLTDPITSKLPVEITSYIFALYLSSESRWSGHAERHLGPNISDMIIPCGAPLRLGAVCKRWRSIAWSLPQLWRTVVVRLDSKHHDLGPELVSQWLGRTTNQPLYIQVGFKERSPVKTPDPKTSIWVDGVFKHGQATMEVICQYASRWKVLDLTNVPGDSKILRPLRHCGSSDHNATSSLQSILLGDERGRREPPIGRKGIFSNSGLQHSPTHLTIVTAIPARKIHINWANVTNLELRRSTYPECFLAITEFASGSPLESLILEDIEPPTNFFLSTYRPKNFPRLHTLKFNETCGDAIRHILQTIRLPSLTCLEFDQGYGADIYDDLEIPVRAISDLLRRSECRLETLTLVNPPVRDNDLVRLLRDMKTLAALNLTFCQWYDNDIEVLLDALSKDDNSNSTPQFLPDLESLVITSKAPRPWSSLIRIFDEEATVIVDENRPVQKPPKRSNLEIVFCSWSEVSMDGEDGEDIGALLDRGSFLKLISLWCDYGIDCSILYSPLHDIDSDDFLQDCYDLHFGEANGDPDSRILNRLRQLPLFN